MANLKLSGDTSGVITVAVPAAAGTNIDIPDGGMLFSEGMFIDLPTTSPANSITHVTLLFEGGAAA